MVMTAINPQRNHKIEKAELASMISYPQ